ncbi:restriction endonuclease [Nitrobacter vulgaris]|uniref:Restriction endonuclease type IV Mrr domain-containing protein n=1 Tax=Nitrobacter vulgaris TaxID=29421 RepID=A0A1V4HW94_NITVU|nr:restriction endonuclease [Nitrobacter vulgaris]OPH81830.1 hypothetical protein B2M20_15235 [Nitrobacter vulgaris]
MTEDGETDGDGPNGAPKWVLPTEIPFKELKGRALEECLFWLLDGIGARDLEWRLGGIGSGAADGGRDLEARFYTPGADGQIEPKRWWVECKGRTGTVEKDAVTSACNNVLSDRNVDCLLIVTNTTFSNPTRDWVKTWQARFPKPQVLLWDQPVLERMLSDQPSTVLRLFESGLSSAGYLRAITERFWSLLEFSSIERARRIWAERQTLKIGPMERIALIANEFAHGSIHERPWGGYCTAQEVFAACSMAIFNLLFLYSKLMKAGLKQEPIVEAVAYLILASLRHEQSDRLHEVMEIALRTEAGEPFPAKVLDLLLGPILDRLRGDLQLVCSSDCDRFDRADSLKHWERRHPIEGYWSRFGRHGTPPKANDQSYARLERTAEPCRVGFQVDNPRSCPLYQTDISVENLNDFFAIATRVLKFRTPVLSRRQKATQCTSAPSSS